MREQKKPNFLFSDPSSLKPMVSDIILGGKVDKARKQGE
jgi:hypothetical protein